MEHPIKVQLRVEWKDDKDRVKILTFGGDVVEVVGSLYPREMKAINLACVSLTELIRDLGR